MNIDSINNGIVIDHITAGRGMYIYDLLGLGELECPVALIKNAGSPKMGKKDIIKIDGSADINLDAIGYADPGVTINYIENGVRVKKTTVDLPLRLVNVIRCKNPRCISSCEQELDQIFKLTDRGTKEYRCIYCETKGKA